MLSRPKLIVPLFALLAVLLAGCGGAEQGGGSQDGGSQDGGQQQESKKPSKKEAQETKIGLGNVVSVKPDKRRMVVMPSQKAEGAEKLTVNVRKTAKITLGGKEAEMGDVAEGQQAQVEYVVKNEKNRAVSVQLFKAEDSPEEQPSGGEGTSN